MKPIDYDALFKSKKLSSVLTSIIFSITFEKKNYNNSTATSTSAKDKSDQVPIKKSPVNEPQEKQYDSYEISIDLSSSLFKEDIYLIDKDDRNNQLRSIIILLSRPL